MKKIFSVFLMILLCLNFSCPVFANSDAKDGVLSVHKNSKHLHSRLSKHYVGYEYTIKNHTKLPVEIQDLSLTDNVSGETAYVSIKRTGLGAAAVALSAGVALMLPTLTISVILAAISVPFIIVGNIFGNIGAHQEANRFSKNIKDNVIQPKETVIFTTLARRFHPPELKIFYKNPETNEISELLVK